MTDSHSYPDMPRAEPSATVDEALHQMREEHWYGFPGYREGFYAGFNAPRPSPVAQAPVYPDALDRLGEALEQHGVEVALRGRVNQIAMRGVAQSAPEPAAWICWYQGNRDATVLKSRMEDWLRLGRKVEPVYAAPAQALPELHAWRFIKSDGQWSPWIVLPDAEAVAAFKDLMGHNLERGTHQLQSFFAAPSPLSSTDPRCTCAAIVNPNIPHARSCPLSSTESN